MSYQAEDNTTICVFLSRRTFGDKHTQTHTGLVLLIVNVLV